MYSEEHPYSIHRCSTTVILTTPSALHIHAGVIEISGYQGADDHTLSWPILTMFYTGSSGHWSKKWMTAVVECQTPLTHVTCLVDCFAFSFPDPLHYQVCSFTNCPRRCHKRTAQRSTPTLHIPALSLKPPHTSKEVQRIQAVLVRSKHEVDACGVTSSPVLERSRWHLHVYIVNHLKTKTPTEVGVKPLPNCPKSEWKAFDLIYLHILVYMYIMCIYIYCINIILYHIILHIHIFDVKSIYLSSTYLLQWFESILDLVSFLPKTGGRSFLAHLRGWSFERLLQAYLVATSGTALRQCLSCHVKIWRLE